MPSEVPRSAILPRSPEVTRNGASTSSFVPFDCNRDTKKTKTGIQKLVEEGYELVSNVWSANDSQCSCRFWIACSKVQPYRLRPLCIPFQPFPSDLSPCCCSGGHSLPDLQLSNLGSYSPSRGAPRRSTGAGRSPPRK